MVIRSRGIGGGQSPRRLVVVAAATVIVLGSAFGVEQVYLRDRYQALPPLASLYVWAQSVSDERIAMSGPFDNITYPLYGRNDSNHVQAVGVPGPEGSFAPAGNCRQFRLAVDRDHDDYVVTVLQGGLAQSNSVGGNATVWTATDHSSRLILRRSISALNVIVSVFRLDGPLHPGQCLQA
jgi:hypothetical protein